MESALDAHHQEFDGKGQQDETHDPGEDLLSRMAQEPPDLFRQGHGYPQNGAQSGDNSHKGQPRGKGITQLRVNNGNTDGRRSRHQGDGEWHHGDIAILGLGLVMFLIAITHAFSFFFGAGHGNSHEKNQQAPRDTEIVDGDTEKGEYMVTAEYGDHHNNKNRDGAGEGHLHFLRLIHLSREPQEHGDEDERVQHNEEAGGYFNIVRIVHTLSISLLFQLFPEIATRHQ